MKHLLLVFVLLFAVVAGATAQTSDKAKRSAEVLEKMRQLDLLNQILPLALTKEQIRKLLPDIEKARRDVKAQEVLEADLILKYAERVDKGVKDGVEKGDVPDKAFLKELNALIRTMTMRRMAIASDNVTLVLESMKKNLNAGQLKAAANSLDPKYFMPDVKIEEIKEEDKLKMFVREILLDPQAYDVLVKIQAGQRG